MGAILAIATVILKLLLSKQATKDNFFFLIETQSQKESILISLTITH